MDVNTDKSFRKEFKQCPVCGSEKRYFEGLLREAQSQGLIDPKFMCFDFQQQQGVPVSQQKIETLPLGAEVQGFNRVWDTCCGCGVVYSTLLETTIAKKSLAKPSLILPDSPNRAERRRLGRTGEFKYGNN